MIVEVGVAQIPYVILLFGRDTQASVRSQQMYQESKPSTGVGVAYNCGGKLFKRSNYSILSRHYRQTAALKCCYDLVMS